MQIQLDKKQIREMVSGFIKVVAKKPTVPVLGHILFNYEGSEATATVTDLEQRLTYVLPDECVSGGKGQFLFPLDDFRKLRSAVKKKDDRAVLKPVSDEEIELQTGQGDQMLSRKIGSMSTEEFPIDAVNVPLHNCDAGKVVSAFRKAAVSVSTEPGRRVLQGVYADPERGAFVGTDGKRLSIISVPDFPLETDAVIPADKPLCKFLDDKSCEGKAGVLDKDSSQYFELRKERWRYQCRCIEGMYPNFEQVIPDDNTDWLAGVTFSDEDIEIVENAVKQFPKSQEKITYFYSDKGEAVLCAKDDNGSITGLKLTGCEVYSQEPVSFTLNRDFLLDVLKQGFRHGHIPSDLSPLKFKNQSDLHVLMPHPKEATEDIKTYAQKLIGDGKPVKSQENKSETNQSKQEDTKVSNTKNQNQTTAQAETEERSKSQQQSAQTSGQSQKQGLKVVDSEDPMAALKEMFTETQETVRQANNSMRELRKQITAVERHYKDREKNIKNREKEINKNLKLLEKVQDAVNS